MRRMTSLLTLRRETITFSLSRAFLRPVINHGAHQGVQLYTTDAGELYYPGREAQEHSLSQRWDHTRVGSRFKSDGM